MAGSLKKTGVAAYVPHRWLMLTAAGAATVGLACGIAKPAMAEWWKLARFHRRTTVSKPVPVENGFAGTIRKLTAESRRAAEQGDHARAVQLAERAAKISEAAAQVVGPQGDCSPQQTARFLAQTRAQQYGRNVAALPTPGPAPQQPQQVQKAAPIAPVQPIVAARPPVQPARTPAPPAPTAPRVTPPSAKPEASAVVAAPRSSGPTLFGPAVVHSSNPSSRRPATVVPPSPSQPSRAEELLAQSRQEAAAGQYDRAIALADQAIAASPAASLFGAGTRSLDTNEAVQWRKYLVSQRGAMLAAANAKKTLPNSKSQKFPAPERNAVAKSPTKADSRFDQSLSIAAVTTRPATRDSLWTEELPPAPAPRVKHQHEANQFQRSDISRQSESFDTATNDQKDSGHLRASNSIAPNQPIESSNDELPASQEAMDAMPEFPIADSTATSIAASKTTSSIPSADRTNDEVEMISSRGAVPIARPQVRLRAEIQQVAGEFPVGSSPARHRFGNVPSRPERPRFDQTFEAPSEPENLVPKKATADEFLTTTAESPIADFPMNRVLELRERLQTVSSFDPGASTIDATEEADAPQGQANAAAWEGDWQQSASTPAVPQESGSVSSSKRSALKLREPRAVLTDDPIDPVAKVSNRMAAPSGDRSEFVGHSEISHWKSAEQSESPPGAGRERISISQTAYESPLPNSATSSSAEPTPSAPTPPEWNDEGLKRKRDDSNEVARKRSHKSVEPSSAKSTLSSVFAAGGFLLLGFGLASARTALKKRHDS